MARSRRPSPASTSSRVYFVTQRAVRGRPGARRLGARGAPDRRPAASRRSPRSSSAGGGLGWIRLVGDIVAGAGDPLALVSRPRTTTPGPTAGRTSRSRRSSGPGSCRIGRRRSGCPASSRRSCWSSTCLDRRPAGVLLAGVLAALLAPFQFFAFPATYLIVASCTSSRRERGGRGRSSATPSCSWPRSCSRGRSSLDAVAAPGRRRRVQGRGRLGRRLLRRTGGRRLLLPDQPRASRSSWRSSRRLTARRLRARAVPRWRGSSRCSSCRTSSG